MASDNRLLCSLTAVRLNEALYDLKTRVMGDSLRYEWKDNYIHDVFQFLNTERKFYDQEM